MLVGPRGWAVLRLGAARFTVKPSWPAQPSTGEAPVQQRQGPRGWTGFDGLGLALVFHLETVHLG